MKVTIDQDIFTKIPNFNILAYQISYKSADVAKIQNDLLNIDVPYTIDEVVSIKRIKEVRDIYKKMGLDPSHTRCAQEALIRRAINHKLNAIHPLVDLGNILSIKTLRSVCVADFDLIDKIYITIGKDGERIDPINRESINLNHLIIYKDSQGVFGSTTSDSKRTRVSEKTINYLLMIILFTKEDNEEQILKELLDKYLENYNIQKIEVE